MIIRPGQEYKHIELFIVEDTGAFVKFYIKSQTHAGINFANYGSGRSFFSEKTGWYLKSACFPEVKESECTLFVRGSNSRKDYFHLQTSKQIFEMIQETIDEYNETFGVTKITIPDEQIVFITSIRRNVIRKPFKEVKTHNYEVGTELSDFNK